MKSSRQKVLWRRSAAVTLSPPTVRSLRRRCLALALSFAAIAAVVHATPASAASWQVLGGPVASGTNGSPLTITRLDSSGNPVVVWSGFDSNAPTTHLSTWNGSAWVTYGPTINGAVSDMQLDPSGHPIVGTVSATNGYVSQWNGSGWQALGTPFPATNQIWILQQSPLTVAYVPVTGSFHVPGPFVIATLTAGSWTLSAPQSPPDHATAPPDAITMDGSTLVVAYLVGNPTRHPNGGLNADLIVDRDNTGSWTQLGGALNVNPENGVGSALLAAANGVISLGWWEGTMVDQPTSFVDQWTGTAWQPLGGSVFLTGGVEQLVVDASGVPTIAGRSLGYTFLDPSHGPAAQTWNGSGWVALGGPATDTTRRAIGDLSLAAGGGQLLMAWSDYQTDANDNQISQLHVAEGSATADTSSTIPGSSTTTTTAAPPTTLAPTTTTRPPTTTTTKPPTTTTTRRPTTTTTTKPPTTTTTKPAPTTTTTVPSTPGLNVMPNPGFETTGTPADFWGGSLTRTPTAAHTGSYGLNQAVTSTSGGWDLDADAAWQAPLIAGKKYTAAMWVRSTQSAKVDLIAGLMSTAHKNLDEADGSKVTLAANTWTQLTVTFTPTAKQAFESTQINFTGATKNSTIAYDDMRLTTS